MKNLLVLILSLVIFFNPLQQIFAEENSNQIISDDSSSVNIKDTATNEISFNNIWKEYKYMIIGGAVFIGVCVKILYDKKNNDKEQIISGKSSDNFENNDAYFYFKQGNERFDKKEYDKAIDDFTKAIELNPNDADYYFCRGLAWQYKKEYDKAIADYSKVIEFKPNMNDIYHFRGYVWQAKADYLSMKNSHKIPLYEYDKALADYTKAIEFNPDDFDNYDGRGLIWLNKKEFDKAIADYNKAIELNPNETSGYWGLANLYATSSNENYRNGKMAIEYALKACSISQSSDNLDALAAAYATSGLFEKAIETQTKAIKIRTKDINISNEMDEFIKAESLKRLELYKQKKIYIDY